MAVNQCEIVGKKLAEFKKNSYLCSIIEEQKDDIRNVQKQSESGIGRETFQHA
jgi:hypothetical protein